MTEEQPDNNGVFMFLDSYARVEIMGHQVIVGRVTEVTRYGVQFCSVEPIDKEGNLGRAVLHGGASIFRETPLTREEAMELAAASSWRCVRELPGHEDLEPDDEEVGF